MSNKYNVRIIIAEYLRVILLRLSNKMLFDLSNLYVYIKLNGCFINFSLNIFALKCVYKVCAFNDKKKSMNYWGLENN
jgi:hypothetical protein